MKEEALQFPIELFPKVFQEIARDCVNRWLSLYSGQSYTINRKSTDDVIHVKKPFVCVLGSIQPEVLVKTFSGEMKENGMFQRILFVPNSSEDKPLIWSIEGKN